eukprot:snap_masked-scaffold_4-processed-gene-14.26-mRNA-1 protein AED:0.49 eAED:0.51 QI:0/-1/0/1/-1/1/1/0/83
MRYYCDYCDMYLPHSSATSRKQHNYGWKHRDNYKAFYQKLYAKQKREELERNRDSLPAHLIKEMESKIRAYEVAPQSSYSGLG